MRPLWILFGLMTATPLCAQNLASGFADLSYGGLQGGEIAGHGQIESSWDIGDFGLQVGASAASIAAQDRSAAFRAILTRDMRWPVRLGLSVAYETNDGVWDDAITFGFNGLYRSDSSTFEANLLLPNHIRQTGTFSFNIAGEQWLDPKLSIKTELFRLSTDLEDPDYYTISLTANYVATESLTVFAQGFQTTSDDYDIKGNGTHLGVAYQFSPQARLRVSLDSVRPEGGDAIFGASLGLQYDFGSAGERGHMFQTAIVPDKFWLGAFETRL